MNYLKIIKNGDQYFFERDAQLGFDPRKHYNIGNFPTEKKSISKEGIVKFGKLINVNPVNISDIPPTLLFVAVNNVYSYPFSLFVPMDMKLDEFSNQVAQYIFLKQQLPNNLTGFSYINYDELDNGYIDPVTWNHKALNDGRLWVTENTLISSIQSVIEIAKSFKHIND